MHLIRQDTVDLCQVAVASRFGKIHVNFVSSTTRAPGVQPMGVREAEVARAPCRGGGNFGVSSLSRN